jgi:23S rRNA pseudouridine2605 synthase
MEERLQKILSRAGLSSRRKAERMIAEGRISINGVVAIEPGTKADTEKDEIRVDGRLVSVETERIYVMLNKPPSVVTTLNDPQGRAIVTDLLNGVGERVYPVGRLDYDSEGLLLLTNDGEFAQRLQHPRYGIRKSYRVKVEGKIDKGELKSLENGIDLPDGTFSPVTLLVEKRNPGSTWLGMTITDGRNRVIRRAFDAIGHPVTRLIRVAVAELTLGSLATGAWRMLTPAEVDRLLLLAGSGKMKKNCLDIHLKINNSRRN